MTLVVYDTAGVIQRVVTGNYDLPQGIPYLETEIPQGKSIVRVDTTTKPHTPVYEDVAPTDIDIMKQQIAALTQAVADAKEYSLIALEGTASVYEATLPFLPD